MSERAAVLCFNDWAGYLEMPVTVVGETPKMYRITPPAGEAIRLAGYSRYLSPGKTALVPKHAVKFTVPNDMP